VRQEFFDSDRGRVSFEEDVAFGIGFWRAPEPTNGRP
jgi:hypothetical protein